MQPPVSYQVMTSDGSFNVVNRLVYAIALISVACVHPAYQEPATGGAGRAVKAVLLSSLRKERVGQDFRRTEAPSTASFDAEVHRCSRQLGIGAACVEKPHRWVLFSEWEWYSPDSGSVRLRVMDELPNMSGLGSSAIYWTFARHDGVWAVTSQGGIDLIDYFIPRGKSQRVIVSPAR